MRFEARAAVSDLIQNYWRGDVATGHFEYDCPVKGGCMWEGAQAEMVLYSWWKTTGSKEAALRIKAHWNWLKSNHPPPDLVSCGAQSKENYASDDTGWDITLMLHAYEITHDDAAIMLAKETLDCARSRWWDTAFGGGFWYDDGRTRKTLYQSILILDEINYFELTRDHDYLTNAIEDEHWVATHLMVTSGNNILTPLADGLYFNEFTANGCVGKPGPTGCPYHMRYSKLTQSQTMLVGNMAMCVADWRLYKIIGDKKYRTQMLATAESIRSVEVNIYPKEGNSASIAVLTNDQDASVNGYEATAFASEVVPNLPRSSMIIYRNIFKSSARAIRENDRLADGFYSGDWQGPATAGIWETHDKRSGPKRIAVSANAVNLVIAALAAQDPKGSNTH